MEKPRKSGGTKKPQQILPQKLVTFCLHSFLATYLPRPDVFVMVANNDWMPLCCACRINSLYIGREATAWKQALPASKAGPVLAFVSSFISHESLSYYSKVITTRTYRLKIPSKRQTQF